MSKVKIAPGIHKRADGRIDVRTTLRLNPGMDADLIDILTAAAGAGSLAAAIKSLMRSGIIPETYGESDPEEEIDISGLGEDL